MGKIKRLQLTTLIMELVSIIDQDLHKDVTIKEFYSRIEDKSVIAWLKEKFPEADFNAFDRYAEGTGEFNEHLWSFHNAYSGNEQKKWGIERNGICLLLAWTNEMIQQGYYTD